MNNDKNVAFKFKDRASRVELLVRIPFVLILLMVGGMWGIFAEIAIMLQWFHVLLTGKRSRRLWRFIARFLNFYTRLWAYAGILTDARPTGKGALDRDADEPDEVSKVEEPRVIGIEHMENDD